MYFTRSSSDVAVTLIRLRVVYCFTSVFVRSTAVSSVPLSSDRCTVETNNRGNEKPTRRTSARNNVPSLADAHTYAYLRTYHYTMCARRTRWRRPPPRDVYDVLSNTRALIPPTSNRRRIMRIDDVSGKLCVFHHNIRLPNRARPNRL